MKKCKDCDREIDKYAIACQYCGKLDQKDEHMESFHEPKDKTKGENSE